MHIRPTGALSRTEVHASVMILDIMSFMISLVHFLTDYGSNICLYLDLKLQYHTSLEHGQVYTYVYTYVATSSDFICIKNTCFDETNAVSDRILL